MKNVFIVRLYFKDGSYKDWTTFYFTTLKRACEFGEYKCRTWSQVESYQIITPSINPEFHRLKERGY